MIKTSVIIATRNRPRLLPRAIESAQAAGKNVEIVVVDDASTDETETVCRKLREIKYVRLARRQRLGGARNVGILASTGEFVTFLDDDDVRLPGSLDLQSETLASASEEVGFVYGQALLGDSDCVPKGGLYPVLCPEGDIFWELLEQNFIPCMSSVFRKSCLARIGLLDDSLPGIEDWDLWIRISELYTVLALKQPVAIYRLATPVSEQLSSRTSEMVKLINRTHKDRWLRLPRVAESLPQQRRSVRRRFINNITDHLVYEAAAALRGGHLAATRKNLLMALRLDPLRVARSAARVQALRFVLNEFSNKRRRAGA